MGLRDRLFSSVPAAGSQEGDPAGRRFAFQQIKLSFHRRLIEYIDEAGISVANDAATAQREVIALLERLLEEENPPLNQNERLQLIQDLQDETLGFGPLEPLLRDPSVSDILVNRWDEVFVERAGRLEKAEAFFRDDLHVRQIIDRIVSRAGRRIDEASPMVDARLPDGSRVNAVVPPLSVDGPVLSIRRQRQQALTMDDLLRAGTLSPAAATLLKTAVKARLNILISGGTGSGKTTLMNILLQNVRKDERLISIEDTIEIRADGLHCIRLETRPPNVEGQGEITQRSLLKNVLRMRPDRIIVGEVRGAEACDMIQAMNTGHKGSLTTIHANSPRDALARLETMILMAGINLTSEAMRRQISSAIDLILQLERFPDGVRRIVSISEVTGMEEQTVQLQELFRYQHSKQPGKTSQGEFTATGIIPGFFEELQATGHPLSPALFNVSGRQAGKEN